MNRVFLLGYAGTDVDIYTFQGGQKKASFRMATSEYYKDKDGESQQKTEWHNIVAFHTKVDIVEKLVKKGSHVLIEGKLQYRKYTNKEGQEIQLAEIIISNIHVIDKKGIKGENGKEESQPQVNNKGLPEGDANGDDLPF